MAVITNSTDNTLISGTSSADSIVNSSGVLGVTVDSGAGNDTIIGGNIINAGDGDNYVNIQGKDGVVKTGSGNDFIVGGNTVNPGKGNDTILVGEEGYDEYGEYTGWHDDTTIEYAEGDGKDVVIGYTDGIVYMDEAKTEIDLINGGNSFKITSGSISSASIKGNDIILNIGTGSITLKDAKDQKVNLRTEDYTNEDGETQSDIIFYDIVNNQLLNNSEVLLGKYYRGAAGADYLTLTNDYSEYDYYDYLINTTIKAAGGNDTLDLSTRIDGYGYNTNIIYSNGDGNDVVIGYKVDDTIQLTSSSISNVTSSGDDVKLTIGTGSINLKDAKNKMISVKNSSGDINRFIFDGKNTINAIYARDYTNYDPDSMPAASTVPGTSTADYIYADENGDILINAGAGNDTIDAKVKVSINAGAGNDIINTRYGTIIYSNGDGNDTVNFDNYLAYSSDFGSIDKKSADRELVLTADTSISSVSYKDNNYTFKIGTGRLELKNINTGSMANKLNVQTTNNDGSYNYWKYINGKVFNRNATIVETWEGSGEYKLSADSTGTSENDYINFNLSDYDESTSVISGEAGDDYIEVDGSKGQVYGGTGNDTIVSYNLYDGTIDGSNGDDLIQVIGGSHWGDAENEIGDLNLSISGGIGNDVVEVQQWSQKRTGYYVYDGEASEDVWSNTASKDDGKFGTKVTINAGEGNDTIRNSFVNLPANFTQEIQINDNDGADDHYTLTSSINTTTNTLTQIKNRSNGNNSTVVSSMIYNRLIQYADGDGDDVVEDYNVGDTIQVTEGTIDSKTASGLDVVLKIGEGSITLKNAADKELTIINADGSVTTDTIEAEITPPTGLTYNDNRTILTVASNYNGVLNPDKYYPSVITIDASSRGKAINITGNGYDNSLVGSTKNDTINSGDGNDTIIGGKGNDSLAGGSGNDIFVYNDGDGADVITDFKTGDTLQLKSGTIDKITTSNKNNNVVLTIGKGTITLKDSKEEAIAVNHADGSTSTILGNINAFTNDLSDAKIASDILNDSIVNYANGSNAEIDGGAGNDFIDNYAVSVIINGDAGNDNINNFGNKATINGGAGNDTLYLNDSQYSTVMGGVGTDSIIVGDSSYNTINGGAGNDTIKLDPNSSNLVIQYNNGGGKDVISNYAEGVATIQTIGTTVTKVANGGKSAPDDVIFTLVNGRTSGTITLKNGAGKAVTFLDDEGNLTTQAYGSTSITLTDSFSDTIDVTKDATVLKIDGSSRTKAVEITGNAKANTLGGGSGNDILTGGSGKDVFVYTGGDDIITDYKAGQDIIQLVGKTYSSATYVGESGTDLVLSFVEGGTLTIENVVPIKSVKKVLTKQPPQKVTIIDKDGINNGAQVYGADYASTIDVVNADGDSIIANPVVDYINAKSRSKVVALIGNSKNNTIIGGSKADTINGLTGNNVLTGNGGKDVFIVNAANGSDTITDYVAKQDSIVAAADYSSYKVEEKDVIFNFSGTNNTLTVKNGKNKIINFNGVDKTFNDVYEFVLPAETKDDTVTTFDFNESEYSGITKIDASNRKKSVSIIANSSGNSIISGKAADTITLGNGADTIVYTSGYGNDTIKNYSANDVIQLGKNTSISKAQIVAVKDGDGNVTSSNYVFTIGKNKLTVTDIDNKTITFVDNDNNEILYRKRSISANFEERNYAEAWFTQDDNIIASELDAILDNNSSIISNDNNYAVETALTGKQFNQQLEIMQSAKSSLNKQLK